MICAKMTKKERARASVLKNIMAGRRAVTHATYSEIITMMRCHAAEESIDDAMKDTKLYILHGGEYCEYLELFHGET